jgi:hypothetical protein
MGGLKGNPQFHKKNYKQIVEANIEKTKRGKKKTKP